MSTASRPYDSGSLLRLEWPAVTAIVAAQCAFAPSREAAQALAPVTPDPAAQMRRGHTIELAALRRDGADPHIGGAADLRPGLDRIAKGGALDGGSLFAIAETLRVVDRLQGELTRGGPLLAAVATELAPLRGLRSQLERAVGPDGTLNDSASPLLGGLRAHLRGALERLRARLEGLAHAKAYAPHLQEAIVTLRNGRYVLPVRAEAKSKVAGIVHDTSATGQTIWIEPLEVVELGNALREAEAAVSAEEARILSALSAIVAREEVALRRDLELLTEVDLVRAIADVAAARGWEFAETASDGRLELRTARHPLLVGDPVPIDLRLDATQRVLLITGPNTGGKTVALKTVGLLTAMHAAGLPIPAGEGSAIPPTGGVWADIGDDQSIAQSLSTFSGHLTSILRIHAAAAPGDLVLLDEAGAGTDPAEGAALAAAIIDDFRLRGVRLLATSHYAELKQYAHVTEGVQNGAVEFDLATLRPTYRLTVGAPGGSQAFAIAQKLGLPTPLLEAAQRRRSDQGAALDASLAAAATARIGADEARSIAERLQERADEALRAAVQARREAEGELAIARKTATERAAEYAQSLLTKADALRAALASGSVTPQLVDAEGALRDELRSAASPGAAAEAAASADMQEASVGDLVETQGGSRGEIVALDPARRRCTIAFGGLRAEVDYAEIVAIVGRAHASPVLTSRPSPPPGATARLDLRGARVEDALLALEARIDAVLLAGGDRLEIIHGVGTGALRDAVRRRLRELNEVREVRDADAAGRDGVTIAIL